MRTARFQGDGIVSQVARLPCNNRYPLCQSRFTCSPIRIFSVPEFEARSLIFVFSFLLFCLVLFVPAGEVHPAPLVQRCLSEALLRFGQACAKVPSQPPHVAHVLHGLHHVRGRCVPLVHPFVPFVSVFYLFKFISLSFFFLEVSHLFGSFMLFDF